MKRSQECRAEAKRSSALAKVKKYMAAKSSAVAVISQSDHGALDQRAQGFACHLVVVFSPLC